MSLLTTIDQELVVALKEKKAELVSTLRLMKTAIKNAEIAKRPAELSADDEIKILRSEVKKRLDSIEAYTQGNRTDLVAKEQAEIEIIKKYLPAEMDQVMVRKVIEETVKKVGATTAKDFGKAMGASMKALGPSADGPTVSKILKELLTP